MKKKSILWSLLAIMMVAVLSVGFAACGSSSSDDDSGVVGTWEGAVSGGQLTLQVNAGGNGTWIMIEAGSYGTETHSGSFTYSMTDATSGIVVVSGNGSYGNEATILYYVVQGNILMLYSDQAQKSLVAALTRK